MCSTLFVVNSEWNGGCFQLSEPPLLFVHSVSLFSECFVLENVRSFGWDQTWRSNHAVALVFVI